MQCNEGNESSEKVEFTLTLEHIYFNNNNNNTNARRTFECKTIFVLLNLNIVSSIFRFYFSI